MIEYTETAIVIPLADLPEVKLNREGDPVAPYLSFATPNICQDALLDVAARVLWVREKFEAQARANEEKAARELGVMVEAIRSGLGEQAGLLSESSLRDLAAAMRKADGLTIYVRSE